MIGLSEGCFCGTHFWIVKEGNLSWGNRLAVDSFSETGTTPTFRFSCALLRYPAFFSECSQDAAGKAMFPAIVDNGPLLAEEVFSLQKILVYAHADMIPG